jgi:hypothetical protein
MAVLFLRGVTFFSKQQSIANGSFNAKTTQTIAYGNAFGFHIGDKYLGKLLLMRSFYKQPLL